MLKPIERMESRLQQLEHQLEKLTTKSNCSGLPHCTRISAPAFCCSESNTSSFCNEGIDYPPGEASEFEKTNIVCNGMPKLFHDAKFRPSLVVRAPEFSCGEDEENNDDLESLDPPCIKPKQTLSADDAIAAALSGFVSMTKFNPSEYIQTISGSSSEVDEKNLHESCQMKSQEFSAAENGNREFSQFTQIISIVASGFTEEEYLDNTQYSSDMDFAFKNMEKNHGDGMIPPSTQSQNLSTCADFCDFNGNESMHTVIFDDKELGISQVMGLDSGCVSVIPERCAELERCFKDDTPNISESSSASVLNFEFPILEVEFTSDGLAGSNVQAHSIPGSADDDGNVEQINVANDDV